MREKRGVGNSEMTRGGFLIWSGSLLLLGSGALAGCGGGEAGGEEASGEARTIEHKYGTTEIPSSLERVVTVGLTDHDPVLALEATPVAVREWIGGRAIWPWARDELGDAEPEILSSTRLNFEQIAALDPDLIIGISSGMTEDEYETLSEIAPTLPQSDEYVDYGVPWQDQMRVIGRALGREDRAGEIISEVEARFEAVREEHPEFEGASGVVVLPGPDGTYFPYGPQDARGRFMASLGFELPSEIAELAGDEFYATISGERLGLLDTDVLVWLTTPQQRADIEENQVYQQLAVVSEGRDIFLETNEPPAAALSFSTALSLPFALDKLVPRLAAAVDGDSETEATTVS